MYKIITTIDRSKRIGERVLEYLATGKMEVQEATAQAQYDHGIFWVNQDRLRVRMMKKYITQPEAHIHALTKWLKDD